MTTAEELKQLAADARKKSSAYRQFERIVEDCREAAKAGKVAIQTRKYTQTGIKANYAQQGLRLEDAEAKKIYDDQAELYNYLRGAGFDVREQELETPSTLDINMPEAVRKQIEMVKEMVEKDVYIIWDVEEFDSDGKESSIIL